MARRIGREDSEANSPLCSLIYLLLKGANKFHHRWYQLVDKKKETAAKTTDDDLFLPTKSRVDRLVSFLIMIMVLALLVVPVYALYHVGSSFTQANANRSNAICMGIMLVSTLLFSAALALFTKAKRHELLGAAAA